MKHRRVRFTAAANRHINDARRWWIKNRDHRELFAVELERAARILAILPALGTSQDSATPALRRLLMRKVGCHLYYTFDDEQVVVRAVWGARRKHLPAITVASD